ncbi:MAG: Uma2 family endonuclease [Sandaracinaceae bacterium]|nr:Uma2 family endonuclease [Sandaracinaceae bacterium]
MEPARKLATYADLLALPDDVRAEVVAGEIVTLPAPLPRHGRVVRTVSRYIGGPFDDDDDRGGPGGWWILTEVDIELDAHEVVRPDLSGWRRERLTAPWDERPIKTRPDWVCEVLSPSNVSHDRVTKSRLYARSGVPYYWVIDPAARTLEAFVLESDGWKLRGSWAHDATARIPPFDAIELEVGRLFPPGE